MKAPRDTLLLDQGYQPVKVIHWRRAICMTMLGKVEVVAPHPHVIRTVSRHYDVPAVVRLLQSVRVRPLQVRFSRENVYRRDKYRCQYCARRFARRELTLDHVQPRAHGGATHWRNIVAACHVCNRRKADRTPEQAKMPLLNEPRRPRWLRPTLSDLGVEAIPDPWQDWLPAALLAEPA